jgi:hypothetical protein
MMTKQRRYGQKPGTMHIDKRADLLLACSLADGPDDEVLITKEVALWLTLSPQYLNIMRDRGTGPHFIELAPNRIGYRRGDVKVWLNKRKRLRIADKVKP